MGRLGRRALKSHTLGGPTARPADTQRRRRSARRSALAVRRRSGSDSQSQQASDSRQASDDHTLAGWPAGAPPNNQEGDHTLAGWPSGPAGAPPNNQEGDDDGWGQRDVGRSILGATQNPDRDRYAYGYTWPTGNSTIFQTLAGPRTPVFDRGYAGIARDPPQRPQRLMTWLD